MFVVLPTPPPLTRNKRIGWGRATPPSSSCSDFPFSSTCCSAARGTGFHVDFSRAAASVSVLRPGKNAAGRNA